MRLQVSAGSHAFINQAQSLPSSMVGFALARLREIVAPILCMRATACTKFELESIMDSELMRPMDSNRSN